MTVAVVTLLTIMKLGKMPLLRHSQLTLVVIGKFPKFKWKSFIKLELSIFRLYILLKLIKKFVNLQIGLQTAFVIKPKVVQIHLKNKYRFMHIGLVQVAIKPLLRLRVNALVLRDKRLEKYKCSLLAMINTNIHNGPIMLKYYPDFCVDLP